MIWQAEVRIQLKRSILDPAGEAVRRSLQQLGHEEVRQVHIGKLIQLHFEAPDEATAQAALEEMCRKLLVNPVLEQYETSLRQVDEKAGLQA